MFLANAFMVAVTYCFVFFSYRGHQIMWIRSPVLLHLAFLGDVVLLVDICGGLVVSCLPRGKVPNIDIIVYMFFSTVIIMNVGCSWNEIKWLFRVQLLMLALQPAAARETKCHHNDTCVLPNPVIVMSVPSSHEHELTPTGCNKLACLRSCLREFYTRNGQRGPVQTVCSLYVSFSSQLH